MLYLKTNLHLKRDEENLGDKSPFEAKNDGGGNMEKVFRTPIQRNELQSYMRGQYGTFDLLSDPRDQSTCKPSLIDEIKELGRTFYTRDEDYYMCSFS